MLKKLLKYDLKDMFKFLVIFYSIGLFFAILTRLFLNIENSLIMNIIGQYLQKRKNKKYLKQIKI